MYENSYKSPAEFSGLITNTYILAVVLAVVFVGLAILVSGMIDYEGGKTPKDPAKRRVWFFVLSSVLTIAFFLWNFLYVSALIKGAPAKNDFLLHNGISTGVTLVSYFVIGILLSKLMKKGKFGTLFPSEN